MNLIELSNLLKARHDLPGTWEAYAFESLPTGAKEYTHLQVSGGSPTGKEGQFPTWKNCPDTANFILSFEEIAQAKAALQRAETDRSPLLVT